MFLIFKLIILIFISNSRYLTYYKETVFIIFSKAPALLRT